MGTAFSKSKKKKLVHSCKQHCFGTDRSATRQQLASVLRKFHAEYILNIIMDYLPEYSIINTQLSSVSFANDYFHLSSTLYYKKQQAPCIEWLEKKGFDNMSVFHTCVLGDGGSGKSALILRYIQGQFIADYDPTIEDAYRKHVIWGGYNLLVDILDTAGREDFVALRTSWMKNKDIIILLFALNDERSLQDIDSYYDQWMEITDDKGPVILVGNKCDLNKNGEYKDIQEKAIDKAFEWNVPYVETSGKEGINVDLLFEQCLYEAWIQMSHNESD